MAEQSTVQSLDRAFDLLETLCRSRNGMSIGGLSAETGLHKSTVHRLLASMCARGYVQRDAETSVYRAGMRLWLYCTGVGKAILATWDTAEVRDVWQHSDVHAWTEHTIVDEDAFFREIDKVRQLGYALDNEENELGVRCIAAAIPDYRGRASYAISLSAPVSRMTDQRVAELRAPLMAARDEIARALGGGRF